MREIKWYNSNGIYEANGGASANSLFFETKSDNQLFLEMWNHFVGEYANLIHYSLTEVSWSIIFKTKDATTILKIYDKKHKQSKKVKRKSKLSEVGPILSQAMRLFLSNYVAASNRSLGKDGSRVKRRFKKYEFHGVEDYQKRIQVLNKMQQLYTQFKQKYQADESYYDEKMEMGNSCMYRSSKPYYLGLERDHFCVGGFEMIEESSSVLRSFFEANKLNQNPFPNSP